VFKKLIGVNMIFGGGLNFLPSSTWNPLSFISNLEYKKSASIAVDSNISTASFIA